MLRRKTIRTFRPIRQMAAAEAKLLSIKLQACFRSVNYANTWNTCPKITACTVLQHVVKANSQICNENG